jgi:hypothetical protein
VMVKDVYLRVDRKKNGFDEDKETFYSVRGGEGCGEGKRMHSLINLIWHSPPHSRTLPTNFSNAFRCAT